MLFSTNGFFPVIISYGKWKDFIGEDRVDETPDVIDSYSNTIQLSNSGLLEPQARNQYMITAAKMGYDCIIILDTDETIEFPLGIEFFKRQLERLIIKHPTAMGFSVTFDSKRTGGVSFSPRIILNPAFTRYRDRHNQMYYLDNEVLGWNSCHLVGGIIITENKDFRDDNRELRMRERNLRNPIH